jgi:prepilin-type processing-associated H-X9-DG protein/prepilin-type N-terminal cleavage/methylation domain-containing protein
MPIDPGHRPSGPCPGPAARAFTLVELLTVILIVALLATLILATASRPIALARALVCRQHLRDWGLATRLYADDHDDLLPPEGFPNPTERHTNQGWYIQLPRQIQAPRYHDQPWRTNPAAALGNSPWLCPVNRRRSNGNNLFHYCLNQNIDGTSASEASVRLASIPEPTHLVWLFDSKNLPGVGSSNFTHTNLHSGGAHFLFLDGHVAGYPAPAYWDFSRNRPWTNHPHFRWAP